MMMVLLIDSGGGDNNGIGGDDYGDEETENQLRMDYFFSEPKIGPRRLMALDYSSLIPHSCSIKTNSLRQEKLFF